MSAHRNFIPMHGRKSVPTPPLPPPPPTIPGLPSSDEIQAPLDLPKQVRHNRPEGGTEKAASKSVPEAKSEAPARRSTPSVPADQPSTEKTKDKDVTKKTRRFTNLDE